MIFERTVPVRCCAHEQINTAYRTDIIQRDGSFCDENCRLWVGIEWNQLEIGENLLRTAPRLQAVDLHQLWAHVFASGGSSENLWNQAKRTVLFTELSCAIQTEELLFSRDMPFLKRTNRNFEPSRPSPPCLEWNDACFFV